jgi:DNA sulfur modification protein DndB
MRIPALKAKIGTWDYYITVLTFKQVSDFISKIDDQLHKSQSLKELIQRSITQNYLSIKEYVLKQPELFFNSLVLAVYDDYPDWREIEFKYDDFETYEMGLLEFPGKHKIFPVDGQHRVEGIKSALIENPKLENQKIGAIFIGHLNTDPGRKKTRRLFTTLNRYAKPVTPDDIIALDEDDSAAIVTRELLEDYDLFTGKRVVYAKQKAIPQSNKDAITSIITLYQANVELFKDFYYSIHQKKLTKAKLEEQLKFRPNQNDYNAFKAYCIIYWNAFTRFTVIKEFLARQSNYSEPYRNSTTGGNLIFRPIGFLPLIKASIRIKQDKRIDYKRIFLKYDKINFEINKKPWSYVLWNPIEKKMIMNTSTLSELLLLYLYDKQILGKKELTKLKKGYASCLLIEDPGKIISILRGIDKKN